MEEDSSDQITDSRKRSGGAGWVRRFLFLGGGKRGLGAEVAEVRAQSSLRRKESRQPRLYFGDDGTDRGADAGGGAVV